eukprot:4687544-Pleurochrysis_carterae.AAC.4
MPVSRVCLRVELNHCFQTSTEYMLARVDFKAVYASSTRGPSANDFWPTGHSMGSGGLLSFANALTRIRRFASESRP